MYSIAIAVTLGVVLSLVVVALYVSANARRSALQAVNTNLNTLVGVNVAQIASSTTAAGLHPIDDCQ